VDTGFHLVQNLRTEKLKSLANQRTTSSSWAGSPFIVKISNDQMYSASNKNDGAAPNSTISVNPFSPEGRNPAAFRSAGTGVSM
jgi:hypothetical protein